MLGADVHPLACRNRCCLCLTTGSLITVVENTRHDSDAVTIEASTAYVVDHVAADTRISPVDQPPVSDATTARLSGI